MSEDAKAIIADDAGERHIRLVYFIANGSTKLARKLVSKLVELSTPKDKTWSLDYFLLTNMPELLAPNKNEHIWKQLYPVFNKKANIEDWDLNILSHVIMTCSTSQLVKQDIKQLKHLRNEVFHKANTHIEIKQYERHVEIVEGVVKRCCTFIQNSDLTCDMDELLEHFKKGQILKNDEDLQKIRHWYKTDPVSEILLKVDGLSEDQQTINDALKEMMKGLMTITEKEVGLPAVCGLRRTMGMSSIWLAVSSSV